MYEYPRNVGCLRGLQFIMLALMIQILTSCGKDEGFGGTASISGTITEGFYNDDLSMKVDSFPAVDEEVFIVFGTDATPGDRVITGPTGEFCFDYLYPGQYFIYYRSEDIIGTPVEKQWSVQQVDLERGENLNLGRLEKKSLLDFDEGRGTISGVLKKIKYVDESRWPNLVIEYEDFAHEHEVYLTYGDHEYYDVRVRSQENGYFEFSNLIPGHYKIITYKEDVTLVTEHVVLKFEVELEDMDDSHDLGEIEIEAI